jgi:hypothetical protein
MFSTCIHCATPLGRNEAIEAFPVGRRLAFDPKKGRLWVVCRACERWNLSPLDERWEAIEEAERRFRDARLRVSTDHIGLARLREGLDLIRIGDPQRPEMAAWRYGDQFGRRRTRHLLISGAALGAAVSVWGAFLVAGVSAGAFAGIYANPGLWDTLVQGRPGKVVARVIDSDGTPLVIRRRHARMSAIERSDGAEPFWLRVEHTQGTRVMHGPEAMRVAAQILPTVNRFGGARRYVDEAVRLLEDAGSPTAVFNRVQRTFGAKSGDPRPAYPKGDGMIALQKLPGALHALPLRERLALEMALHEESERRALDGELEELTRAWEEAEVIATIADDMFLSPAVTKRVAELRARHAAQDR